MSSNRFTKSDKVDLLNQLAAQSLHLTVSCPWTEESFPWQEMYWGAAPPELRETVLQLDALDIHSVWMPDILSNHDNFHRVRHSKGTLFLNMQTTGTGLFYKTSKRSSRVPDTCMWLPQLLKYAEELGEQRAIADAVTRVVEDVTDLVNTPGQLRRMWPEVIPLLNGDMQYTVRSAKRASNLRDTKLSRCELDYAVEAPVVKRLLAVVTPFIAHARVLSNRSAPDGRPFIARLDDGLNAIRAANTLRDWISQARVEAANPIRVRPAKAIKPAQPKPEAGEHVNLFELLS